MSPRVRSRISSPSSSRQRLSAGAHPLSLPRDDECMRSQTSCLFSFDLRPFTTMASTHTLADVVSLQHRSRCLRVRSQMSSFSSTSTSSGSLADVLPLSNFRLCLSLQRRPPASADSLADVLPLFNVDYVATMGAAGTFLLSPLPDDECLCSQTSSLFRFDHDQDVRGIAQEHPLSLLVTSVVSAGALADVLPLFNTTMGVSGCPHRRPFPQRRCLPDILSAHLSTLIRRCGPTVPNRPGRLYPSDRARSP
jgi:hypothetical protein